MTEKEAKAINDIWERTKEAIAKDQKIATGTFWCRTCGCHQKDCCFEVQGDIYCPDCTSFIIKLAKLPDPMQIPLQLNLL